MTPEVMKGFSDEVMNRLNFEVVASTQKPKDRCQAMTEIIYQDLYEKLEDMTVQCEKTKELLSLIVQTAMWNDFGDESSNVRWASFSKMLSDEMRSRGKSPDVSM